MNFILRRTASSLLVGLILATQANAQIVVQDPASRLATIANTTQTIAQMKLEYELMLSQIEAIKGYKGFGDFDSSAIAGMLPADAQSVWNSYQGNGASGVFDSVNRILQRESINGSSNVQEEERQRRLRIAATNKVVAERAYGGIEKRMEGLNEMTRQISLTQDPKSISELTARINTEQGLIQSEMSKLQVLTQMSDAEMKLSKEREQAAVDQMFSINNKGMATF